MRYLLTRLTIPILALVSLTLVGCAEQNDIQQLNQNQFTLRGMIANDRQEIDSLQQQVRALKDQVNEMQQGGGAPAGRDKMASVNDRLSKLESQVSGLQAGMTAATPGTVPSTAPNTTVASAPPESPGMAPSTAPATTYKEPEPTWPQDLDTELQAAQGSREPGAKGFIAGINAMKAAKYPVAVSKFTEVVHHYPKSELVTPAEYFTANALYESGKYDQSILQFNDVVMRDPKGKYASQSLLREAQAFMKLNDTIDARLTLQKILSDHSDSPEAASATQMMKSLNG